MRPSGFMAQIYPFIGTDPRAEQDGSVAAAGVSETNYVGVYFEHPGQPAPLRNDGYHVDDPQLVLFGDNLDTDQDAIPDTVENSLGLNPS